MHGGNEMYTKFQLDQPKGKRPLEEPRHRWEGNIKMGQEGEDWIHLAKVRDLLQILLNTVMKLQVL